MQTSGPQAPTFASLGSTVAFKPNNSNVTTTQKTNTGNVPTVQAAQGSVQSAVPPPTFHPRPANPGQQPASILSAAPAKSQPQIAQGSQAASLGGQAVPQQVLHQNQISNFTAPPKTYAAPQNSTFKPLAAPEALSKETALENLQKKTIKKDDANFGLCLPLHKVKKLIKSEGDVKAISGEGAFAIARVTELFIEELVSRAYQRAKPETRPPDFLEYDDISATVKKWAACDFLRDIVPETMTLEELTALVERQSNAHKASGTPATKQVTES